MTPHLCISKFQWTVLLLAVVCITSLTLTAAPTSSNPNVLVILTDDQGWGDLSLHGNNNLHTPHLDNLARQGAQFRRFYVSPVCSPTRAEFLTGRYHARGGVYSTSAGGERLDLDEYTIAQTFKAAGYATAAYGKWHNGMQYPYHPNARGFDEFYGFCSGHWGNYFNPVLEHNGKLVRGNGFVIDDFTDRAMEFIEQQNKSGKPFFAYLPYNTPHSPMQVPQEYWSKFEDKTLAMRHREPQRENIPHTRAALAMCENIDWNVGRLLGKLDALNIAKDTIVVYFCDNGPNGFRWNGSMKGRKGSTDEGGVRSPLFIRWPGRIAPGTTIPQIAAAIDLLPTLADLAGIPMVGKNPLDGLSLKPLLQNPSAQWPDRLIFSHWGGRVSVRNQQFRLDHQNNLFDMFQDPEQRNNVSKKNPDTQERLAKAVKKWKQELLPGLRDDHRSFPIGHPDYPYTQIPARDGKAHGNIKRSNRFPNCSFFTSWTNLQDKITWDAEVLASGDFEVEIYYTCPPADVGSEIELSFGSNHLRGRIAQAHNPPLQGMKEDRVRRTESYVKDFKLLKLGTIHLEKGTGQLQFKATEMPGQQVMDFRLLMLTRVSQN